MSQFWQGVTAGALPPSVATSFVTDSGTATPAANILNILTNDTTANNDNGITDIGSGNTVTIELTNRLQGTVTTVGASTQTIVSFNLGITPASYVFQFNLTGFDAVTPTGTAYWFMAGARTDGASATMLGTVEDFAEDVALLASDVDMTAAGNIVSLTVLGEAGKTLNWSAVGTYVKAV